MHNRNPVGPLVCGGACDWAPNRECSLVASDFGKELLSNQCFTAAEYQCCEEPVQPTTMIQDIVGRRELHSTPPVGTFYTEHGGGAYEWSYENKCIPGHNIDNIMGDITYEDCAKRCLACKDDSRCNASLGPCVGIEWFTFGNYEGRCTLSSASSGPPCDNSIYGVQFYSFKELQRDRHGRVLTEEGDSGTKICVFAQNPSAVRSDLQSQGGWVHHDLYDELGAAGFTVTKEEQGLTSTISMDIMCTESEHVTLPAMTPSNEVYGLCT
ncbi:hypothetical protein THAOC_27880, partial [Thalassiosira oceanica]